jgi:hypothetical protein
VHSATIEEEFSRIQKRLNGIEAERNRVIEERAALIARALQDGHRKAEVARLLGVTKMRVSQIVDQTAKATKFQHADGPAPLATAGSTTHEEVTREHHED